jgi:hypothetical protein
LGHGWDCGWMMCGEGSGVTGAELICAELN